MPRVTAPPRPARGPRNSVNDRLGHFALWRRRLRRVLRPAAWAVLATMLLVVLTGLIRGASPGSWLASLRQSIAVEAAGAGLRVTDLVIEGRANTPEPLLRAAIGVSRGDPMLGVSLDAIRQRIETLTWVEVATVERRLPGTIVVNLQERRPFAIWQNAGKFALIDRAGLVVTGQELSAFGGLPLVVGAGAPAAAATLLDALAKRPQLQSRMIAAVRVGERRWNLRLSGGTDVLLPEGDETAALDRLMDLQGSVALLDRPIRTVDLRLADRLVVSPTAAPAATPIPTLSQPMPTPPTPPGPPTPTKKPT